MRLHELAKIKANGKKRLGRGVGSGRGKTAGRGTKGQKARGKIPLKFSGDVAFYKKLPRRRGMGNPKLGLKPKLVTLSELEVFKKGSVVDLEALLGTKVINEEDVKRGVKILGMGEISHAITVKLPASASARQKIEKSGGKVENV